MNSELMDGRPSQPSEPSRPGNAPFIPPPSPAPWDHKPPPWQQTQTEASLDQVPWDRRASQATHHEIRDEWPQMDLADAHPTTETPGSDVMDARAGYESWDPPPPFEMDAHGFVDDRPAEMLDTYEERLVAAAVAAVETPARAVSESENAPPEPIPDPYDSDAPILPDAARQALTPARPSRNGPLGASDVKFEPATPDEPAAVQPSADPLTGQVVATVPINPAALANGPTTFVMAGPESGLPANLVLRIELAMVEEPGAASATQDIGGQPTRAPDATVPRAVEAPEPEPTQAFVEDALAVSDDSAGDKKEEVSEWPSVWQPAVADAFAPRSSRSLAIRPPAPAQLGPTRPAPRVTTIEAPQGDQWSPAAETAAPTGEPAPAEAARARPGPSLLTAGLTVAMAVVVVVLVLVFAQLMTSLLR